MRKDAPPAPVGEVHERANVPPTPVADSPGGDRAGALSPPAGLRGLLATLDPGYFALVMATGIVSIGASLLGQAALSRVLLGLTIAAFVILVLAYSARLIFFAPFVREDLRDPTLAIAFFTVVAGTDVLATRLTMAGHPDVAFGLGVAGAALWLVLTYGLPWSIVAGAAHRPVLADVNGAWLVWVVSTQSLAITAAAVTPHAPAAWLESALPIVAICLWGLGVVLYVILIVIIFFRLLFVEVSPAQMGPAYWIAMGATAISVRAATGILALHGGPAGTLVGELRPFLIGVSVALWAFGTWWIPLLVLLGFWRYVVRRYSWAYEPRLWNVVFPLGMYTVASFSLGHVPGLGFMVSLSRVWVWVGFAAWVAVFALMLAALARASSRRGVRSGDALPSGKAAGAS